MDASKGFTAILDSIMEPPPPRVSPPSSRADQYGLMAVLVREDHRTPLLISMDFLLFLPRLSCQTLPASLSGLRHDPLCFCSAPTRLGYCVSRGGSSSLTPSCNDPSDCPVRGGVIHGQQPCRPQEVPSEGHPPS